MKYVTFTKSKLPYGWLGNMSPYPVEYKGKIWKTTEALFQSMRFNDLSIQEMIRAEVSPMGAKFKAKSLVDRMYISPLSEQDIANMVICCTLKITTYFSLKRELIETKDAVIIEDVTNRGAKGSNLFWGAMFIDGKWEGKNVLGNIWQNIRENIF